MPNGTQLNNVFASRIHKSNASGVLDEAEDMLKYFRDRLLVLAAMAPMNVDEGDGPMTWDFYVRREIEAMWDEIGTNHIRAFMASYIKEYPEDCLDELVKEDEEPKATNE